MENQDNPTNNVNKTTPPAKTKSKLRIGRLIFVIILLVLIIIFARWVLGNAHRVEEIERKMQDLSLKLDTQSKDMHNLNNSLLRFSKGLSNVDNSLYDIQNSLQIQGQTSAHDLTVIKNDIKNIKTKIDNMNIKSEAYGGGYYQ